MPADPSAQSGEKVERDPRVDPREGDVLRKCGGTCVMQKVGINSLSYTWDGPWNATPPMVHWSQNWRPAWREWAATAEVIHKTVGL